MSFTLIGGSFETKATKINSTSPIVIYGGLSSKRTSIVSIFAVETTGATPNLTWDLYDNENAISYPLRDTVAMTAKQTVIWNEPFALQGGWSLRATVSAANQVVCFVNYFSPDAVALGQAAMRA